MDFRCVQAKGDDKAKFPTFWHPWPFPSQGRTEPDMGTRSHSQMVPLSQRVFSTKRAGSACRWIPTSPFEMQVDEKLFEQTSLKTAKHLLHCVPLWRQSARGASANALCSCTNHMHQPQRLKRILRSLTIYKENLGINTFRKLNWTFHVWSTVIQSHLGLLGPVRQQAAWMQHNQPQLSRNDLVCNVCLLP